MQKPIATPDPELLTTFYSDMAVVNGKGILLMGAGKTRCATLASGGAPDDRVSEDLTCLTRQGAHLCGRAGQIMVSNAPLPSPRRIDVVVRCMSDEETEVFPKIAFCDQAKFIRASEFYIAFTSSPAFAMQSSALRPLLNPSFFDKDSILKRFEDLMVGADVQFLLLPWMSTVEDRAELLKQAV